MRTIGTVSLRRMTIMGCFTSYNYRKISVGSIFILLGIVIGILINYYGLAFENIRVDINIQPGEMNQFRLLQTTSPGQAPNNSFYAVPSIVHFIWFGSDKRMRFINYLSILSAHRVQKPDVIMFHCDNLPQGNWWEKLWREVPLKIVHREAPTMIHGQKLRHMYHKGDIAKLEILIKYGGIYLDYDVILLNSMDSLRRYDVSLGKEKPPKFMAGIIVAKKNALFLRMWYESYRNNYRPIDWDFNCSRLTYQIYLKHPELLHVEPYKLTTPDWKDRHLLFKEVIDWSDLFVIHIMGHSLVSEYTPDNIKSLNTTLGEILRYTYYGSSKLL